VFENLRKSNGGGDGGGIGGDDDTTNNRRDDTIPCGSEYHMDRQDLLYQNPSA
jgi:hypothetical protein